MNGSELENPLLLKVSLPRFDLIQTTHLEPAVRQLLSELEERLEQLEKNALPSWEGLV